MQTADPVKSGDGITDERRKRLVDRALLLALITIAYNVIEGAVSVIIGVKDETLSLFGFGLDSFVEVISGIGILHLTIRSAQKNEQSLDRFEQQALRITGTAFYLLALTLFATGAINYYAENMPETTFWGIIISLISILTMSILIKEKKTVGRALESDAIIADANCTRACLLLSIVLLAASVGYEWTGFAGMDAAGAILIGILAAKEGREAFQKAKGKMCSCAA